MRILLLIYLLGFLITCSDHKSSRLDFIVGTWKTEGKEQYEVWETNKNNELIGHSYKLNNDQKTITETLSIKKIGNQIIYEATVPNQNEGKTIQFKLNNEVKTYLSFENIEHDFPKKIQYKRINNNEIEVTVLGDKDKGFSYNQFKQIAK
jgi:hypothetical protein